MKKIFLFISNLPVLGYLLMIMSFSILEACDDRFDFLSSYNSAPTITMGSNTTQGQTGNTFVLNDSLKTSFKHGKSYYSIPVSISDANSNLSTIDIGLASGSAKIILNNNPVPTPIPININNYAFELQNIVDGSIVVNITATDAFNATSTFTINLVAFNNLPPVAEFTYATSNVNGDPYEYVFDASSSFDKDFRFGGGIQAYVWTINGVAIEPISQSTIRQVFPGPGGYQVSLVVVDNDGVSSPVITKTITVN